MHSTDPVQQVRTYYDKNTARFLRTSRTLAIHQPLYTTPGMPTSEAVHTQHHRILAQLSDMDPVTSVLDLGCGVGESILYLAQHTKAEINFHGITLSKAQADIAGSAAGRSAFARRIQIHHGSFLEIPEEIPRADLAYAIESFIHCTDVDLFFRQVSGKLTPGGKLILFDDFLTENPSSGAYERILSDLRSGWLAHTLISPGEVISRAQATGLQHIASENLTPFLRLHRVRDRLMRLAIPVARLLMERSSYCRFMVGGDARQRAYQAGLLNYRMVVLGKE